MFTQPVKINKAIESTENLFILIFLVQGSDYAYYSETYSGKNFCMALYSFIFLQDVRLINVKIIPLTEE